MGVSVDTGRGGRKKPVDAELNLIPFIDLLVCCICFLLITAVWVAMARIDVSQQGPGGPGELPRPPEPRISVLVDDSGYTLTVGTERLSIPKQGAAYDLDGLHKKLLQVRARMPKTEKLTVAADDSIKYRQLVRAMDVALRSHFSQIHVSDAAARL